MRRSDPRHRRQAGTTLIEMIIAVAIGAIVVAGGAEVVVKYQAASRYTETVTDGSSQLKELQALFTRFWNIRMPPGGRTGIGNFTAAQPGFTLTPGKCGAVYCPEMTMVVSRPSGLDTITISSSCQAFVGTGAAALKAIDFTAGGVTTKAASVLDCLTCKAGTRPVVVVTDATQGEKWTFPHNAVAGASQLTKDVLSMSFCFAQVPNTTNPVDTDVRVSYLDQTGKGLRVNSHMGSVPIINNTGVNLMPVY